MAGGGNRHRRVPTRHGEAIVTTDAEAVIAALTTAIRARRDDHEFMARLRRRIEDDKQVLDKLAAYGPVTRAEGTGGDRDA